MVFKDCYEMFDMHWDYNDISYKKRICKIDKKEEARQYVKNLRDSAKKGYRSILFWQVVYSAIYCLKMNKDNYTILYNRNVLHKDMSFDSVIDYLYENRKIFNRGSAVFVEGFGNDCEVGCQYKNCTINPMMKRKTAGAIMDCSEYI